MERSPGPSRISVPELIHQLQVTQDELENLRVSLKVKSCFNFVVESINCEFLYRVESCTRGIYCS